MSSGIIMRSVLGLLSIAALASLIHACSSNSNSGSDTGEDPCAAMTCSGHGECQVHDGHPSCVCDSGYSSDDCSQCADGFSVDSAGACVPSHGGCDTKICGEHGSCSEDGGEVHCVCQTGYDGDACQLCYPGYHRNGNGACTLDETCRPTTCSAHGTCDDSSGKISCTCQTGYAGTNCDKCDDGFHRDPYDNCIPNSDCETNDPCGEHGSCDDSTGDILCKCDDGYAGNLCTKCQAGFHDDGSGTCILDEQCLSTTCSGHGSCVADSGLTTCTCSDGYAGANCTTCAANYHRDDEDNCVADEECSKTDPCGDHGTCDDSSGVIECHCDAGYDGETCDTCHGGYHEDAGQCTLDETCQPNTCSGHGTCSASSGLVSCQCNTGYAGTWCDTCDVGYHLDSDGTCVENDDCTANDPCGLHGTCDDSSGVIECQCQAGYTGKHCDSCYPGYERNMVTGQCEIPCPNDDEYRCNGKCVAGSDVHNCGACGNDCGKLHCLKTNHQYSCGCQATYPWDTCDNACINLLTSPNNCGACGTQCDTAHDEMCFNGKCIQKQPGCNASCNAANDRICCGGHCVLTSTLLTDENHCGSCDNKCNAGEICVHGRCAAPVGSCSYCRQDLQLCCNGSCIYDTHLASDNNNCGGCNIKCSSTETCSGGVCVCKSGYHDCGNGCINLRTDNANCGACGHACGNGEACVYGACVKDNTTGCGNSCTSDQFCCSLSEWPNEECTDLSSMTSNAKHCGGCTPCLEGETCQNGACSCTFTNHTYCNGVCTNLASHDNCGDCGVKCSNVEKCLAGQCKVPAGNTCHNPDNMTNYAASYSLYPETPSGFQSDTCSPSQDGTLCDRFTKYTIPSDGHYKLTVSASRLKTAVVEAWVAQSSDYCDLTTQNLGCASSLNQYTRELDLGQLVTGTNVIVYVYSSDGTCGQYPSSDYYLRFNKI